LSLVNNNISDSGAASIAQAFKRAPTLTSVDLASNKISDCGIEAICEALGERGEGEGLTMGPLKVTNLQV
jgi:hypothetical protein